jgi:hypothetical protein
MAVMNLANGPGEERVPEYVPALAAARAAGVDLVAYIDTDNGNRMHTDVLADIALYRAWYGPVGYLLDRADVAADDVNPYYAPLRHHVKGLDANAIFILNAGAHVAECFMDVADIVIDFEGSCDSYLSTATSMPKWRSKYDPARFWHIVYDVPQTSLESVVRKAQARRTGWLYITDQQIDSAVPGSYLYDRLPDEATWHHLAQLLERSSQ